LVGQFFYFGSHIKFVDVGDDLGGLQVRVEQVFYHVSSPLFFMAFLGAAEAVVSRRQCVLWLLTSAITDGRQC
jgi:hypothetical protein